MNVARPLRRTIGGSMADLITLTFDSPYGAQAALNAVRAREDLPCAWIDDVAVVEKHHSGRVSLHTPHGQLPADRSAGLAVPT